MEITFYYGFTAYVSSASLLVALSVVIRVRFTVELRRGVKSASRSTRSQRRPSSSRFFSYLRLI